MSSEEDNSPILSLSNRPRRSKAQRLQQTEERLEEKLGQGSPRPPAREEPRVEPKPATNASQIAGAITLQIETARVTVDFEDVANNVGDVQAWLWWADLLSRAERELLMLTAAMKRNKACSPRSIKSPIESHPGWFEGQAALAECTRNVVLLREVVAALRIDRGSAHT